MSVPDEVSLIGFDDILLSRYVPPPADNNSISYRHHDDTGGGTGTGGEMPHTRSNPCIESYSGTLIFGINVDGYRTPVGNRLIQSNSMATMLDVSHHASVSKATVS